MKSDLGFSWVDYRWKPEALKYNTVSWREECQQRRENIDFSEAINSFILVYLNGRNAAKGKKGIEVCQQ